MRKITLLCCCLVMTGILKLNAQISVVATGLTGPTGLNMDDNGNLFVAETGSGNNDGKITMIDPSGMKYTIVHGLPSHTDTATHETTGVWRPYVKSDSTMWILIGEGPDPLAGSMMLFDYSQVTLGMDSLSVADTMRTILIQPWVISQGYAQSNPFSAEWDVNGNIYVSDAAANAVVKIDPAGTFSILDTFPAIQNTFTPFPPFIDYVPTKIISDMSGGFYLCNLTGFPFVPQISTVVTIDTSGNVAPKFQGLSQAVDMQIDSMGNLYVLQFGRFDSTGPVMQSASIMRILPDGTLDTLATGFGPSAGMIQDSTDGFYVTELMTGNVLHIANTTAGIKNTPNFINMMAAYPNPFDDVVRVEFTLAENSDVFYTISDQSGKTIFTKTEGKLSKGNHETLLDVKSVNSALSSGIYYLTIKAGDSIRTINLLKK